MKKADYYILGGRFQPFHIGSLALLEYVVKNTGGTIVIGIINPDPNVPWEGDGTDWIRFLPKDNPLNYWERLSCIRAALSGSPLAKSVEAIVPLPRPSVNLERANRFLPPKPRHFVLCERWGDEVEKWKAETYRKNGDSVLMVKCANLPPQSQLAESAVIRSLAVLGGPWELLVPAASATYLKKIDFESRISVGLGRDEAKEILAQFYSSHSLGQFAAELFGDLEDVDVREPRTSPEILRRQLTRRNILGCLRKPVKEHEGEVTVFMESEEWTELQSLIAGMMRSGKLRTVPQGLAAHGGLFEATMTTETMNLLISELANGENSK